MAKKESYPINQDFTSNHPLKTHPLKKLLYKPRSSWVSQYSSPNQSQINSFNSFSHLS